MQIRIQISYFLGNQIYFSISQETQHLFSHEVLETGVLGETREGGRHQTEAEPGGVSSDLYSPLTGCTIWGN